MGGPGGALLGGAGAAGVNELVDLARQDSTNIAAVRAGEITETGQDHARHLAEQALYRHQLWNQPPPDALIGPSGQLVGFETLTMNEQYAGPHRSWASQAYPPSLVDDINGSYNDGSIVYVNDTGSRFLLEDDS